MLLHIQDCKCLPKDRNNQSSQYLYSYGSMDLKLDRIPPFCTDGFLHLNHVPMLVWSLHLLSFHMNLVFEEQQSRWKCSHLRSCVVFDGKIECLVVFSSYSDSSNSRKNKSLQKGNILLFF